MSQVLLYGNDSQHYQVSENSLVDFISYGVLFNILFWKIVLVCINSVLCHRFFFRQFVFYFELGENQKVENPYLCLYT